MGNGGAEFHGDALNGRVFGAALLNQALCLMHQLICRTQGFRAVQTHQTHLELPQEQLQHFFPVGLLVVEFCVQCQQQPFGCYVRGPL